MEISLFIKSSKVFRLEFIAEDFWPVGDNALIDKVRNYLSVMR